MEGARLLYERTSAIVRERNGETIWRDAFQVAWREMTGELLRPAAPALPDALNVLRLVAYWHNEHCEVGSQCHLPYHLAMAVRDCLYAHSQAARERVTTVPTEEGGAP